MPATVNISARQTISSLFSLHLHSLKNSAYTPFKQNTEKIIAAAAATAFIMYSLSVMYRLSSPSHGEKAMNGASATAIKATYSYFIFLCARLYIAVIAHTNAPSNSVISIMIQSSEGMAASTYIAGEAKIFAPHASMAKHSPNESGAPCAA